MCYRRPKLHSGEPPQVEEKGPYVFRQKVSRVGVVFEDGGEAVTFAEKYENWFDPWRSNGAADDPIQILHPAWHQLVSTYRSESGLRRAATSVILLKLLENVGSEMLPTMDMDSLRMALIQVSRMS